MGTMSKLVQRLHKERDRVEKELSGLNAAISAFAGVYTGKAASKRRKLSAAAREKIAAAQRKRWAKAKAKKRK